MFRCMCCGFCTMFFRPGIMDSFRLTTRRSCAILRSSLCIKNGEEPQQDVMKHMKRCRAPSPFRGRLEDADKLGKDMFGGTLKNQMKC